MAAGLEVEKVGVVPLTRDEIMREVYSIFRLGSTKLLGLTEMSEVAAAYRSNRRSMVLTNGCFDLLHVGHVKYLQEAVGLGDVLIVAINSDESVQRLKGAERPIVGQWDRAAMVSALECVDHVLFFNENTPHDLLRELRPDVLVKGGTYAVEEVLGREVVEAYGGKVCVTGKVDDISTTQILAEVQHRGSTLSYCPVGENPQG